MAGLGDRRATFRAHLLSHALRRFVYLVLRGVGRLALGHLSLASLRGRLIEYQLRLR